MCCNTRMACAHTYLGPSLDRWHECHWQLHQMELHYHEPDAFRYSLNAFIRAIADVPELITKNLERHAAVRAVTAPKLKQLKDTKLFSILKLRRNFIVHQGMLEVESKGSVRALEGSKVKIGFPFRIEPWETSDEAYERYKDACRRDKVLRGLGPDCDSSPAIVRTWIIPQIPGRDLLEVAFEAWTLVGQVLSEAVEQFGGNPLDLSMHCRHDPELVRVKRYSQHEFFLSVDGVDLKEESRLWREQRAARTADEPPTS